MKQKRRAMKWKIILSLIVLLVVALIFSIVVLVHANSSQWYFRDTNASTGPTAKASTDTDSFPSVPANKNTPKDMIATKGSAQTSVAGAYIANNLKTMVRIFVGPALGAQTLTGGQAGYKIATGTKESSTSMNLYMRTFVYVWRSGSGNVKTIIVPTSCGTEHGTSERGCVITATGAAGDFSILSGDRIVVEIWFDIRDTTTSYTATLYYDGTTDPVDNTLTSNAASYFYCPQTLLNIAPTNDQLTLDLTGASYKNTKTLLCAKQNYKFVYLCSDANGVTDITYAQIQLDPTGKNVILRATRGSGDAWTFSEYSDTSNYVTLNIGGSSHSTSGNQKTFNFLVTINWAWGDSAETVTVRCYVIDASTASDQDDYTNIFGVEAHLTAYSLTVSDYRCNPSQTSLTFSGYWYYDGTSIVPPDGNYAVVIKLSGAQKGSPDTTLVSGAFSINDVTAESTVNSYSYTVEATYMSGAGSFSAVIVDRIKVLSYTVSDSRANINDYVNIDATLRYEYDNTAITTGTITINGYSASHIGSGVYRITPTSASVTSVTYNTVAGSESTYGLNTVNQNSQTTTVIWDRLQVQSYTLSDSRADISADVNIDALVWFDYDNTVCTTATITINGYSASHIGSGIYRITKTSASVTSVTYNTVACSAETTYGITTVDQNSQSTTVVWDRIRIDSLSAVDSRVDINTQILFYATASLEFDSHPLGSGDSFTLSGYAFVWSAGNNRFEVTETKTTVTSVTINAFSSGSEATYGITVGNINSKTIIGIWDRLEFVSVSADDTRINVGGTFELRYQIRYDFDDVTFDNTKGSITGFVWDSGNSWWDKTVTGSSSVTSTNYDETYISITDSTYGLTVKQDVAGVNVITDRIRIDTLSAIDTRIDISTQGTFYATASLEYDSHALGSGDSLTLGGYVFSWVAGNNRFEYSSTQSSVTSITVNSFTSGNEATYGITTGNINSQTVTLVWDRIIVYWEQLDDSRVNIGTNIEGRYKAVLQFDNHALGSGDSLSCSWGNLAWDNANNWFDLIHSESTVTGVTISGWGGNEATYGITAITENITESTYIYDRIEIYEADEPSIIGSSVIESNFNTQIYAIFFSILIFSFLSIPKKTRKKALVLFLMVSVTILIISPVLATGDKGEHIVNTTVRIWYKARYDYDDVVFDNSKGTLYINGTLATWNGTGGYWYRDVTSSQVGQKTYVVDQVSDTTYGLAAIVHTCSYITITWIEVAGYNLNLRVMNWNLTDTIQGAYVYKDSDIKTSDADGWANWTEVSGTVQIKVQYYGFWVNGTFSVGMDSDKTIDVQCKLYDVTVLVQEGVQNAYLASANVTVYNSTSVQGNKITSGVTGNNGQVQLLNLPNNTLTFTQYGGASYSLVIGNTTQLVSSENQTITLTADQNNVNTNSSYSIIAFMNFSVIPYLLYLFSFAEEPDIVHDDEGLETDFSELDGFFQIMRCENDKAVVRKISEKALIKLNVEHRIVDFPVAKVEYRSRALESWSNMEIRKAFLD